MIFVASSEELNCKSFRSWQILCIPITLLMLVAVEDGMPQVNHKLPNHIEYLYRTYQQTFSEAEEITPQELHRLGETQVVIVDVRGRPERDVSYIPCSISVDEFERQRDRFRGQLIVCYCTIGYRSGNYVLKLQKQGVPAKNLRTGILGWCHCGFRVMNDSGTTNRVHVYGRRWKLLPDGYEAVW